jgi:hypothetical protein
VIARDRLIGKRNITTPPLPPFLCVAKVFGFGFEFRVLILGFGPIRAFSALIRVKALGLI